MRKQENAVTITYACLPWDIIFNSGVNLICIFWRAFKSREQYFLQGKFFAFKFCYSNWNKVKSAGMNK